MAILLICDAGNASIMDPDTGRSPQSQSQSRSSSTSTQTPDSTERQDTDRHDLIDTLVSSLLACDPRRAHRPRTIVHAIGRELLRGATMTLTTLLVLITPVVAQQVGGSGACSTVLQRLASNGVPFLMRWGVVLSMLAAMGGGIAYVIHKTPDKLRTDIEYMKTAGMGAAAVVLAPTFLKLVFGNILGLTLAQCITVGLGLFGGGGSTPAMIEGPDPDTVMATVASIDPVTVVAVFPL